MTHQTHTIRDLTDAQIDAQLVASATNMRLARSIGREDLADICRRSMGQIHAEIERRDTK